MCVVRNAGDTPSEDVPRNAGDTSSENSRAPSELISELRERARFAERQLEETNEANSENRRIIAALIQRGLMLDSADEPLDVPASASGRPRGHGTTNDGDAAELRRDHGLYQPEPGFLPDVEDKLHLRIYVLAVVVPAIALILGSDASTALVPSRLVVDYVMENFAGIFFLLSWYLLAFFIGLKRRRFPWAACIFTGYLGSLLFIAVQDVFEVRLLAEPLSALMDALDFLLSHPDILVENSWFYFSLFLAGVLLGKAVQRRGVNMGLYASEAAPAEEQQAARELSPRMLAILGFAAPIIASFITAMAALFGD